MKKLLLIIFILGSTFLSAEHYLERAKRAHAKLDDFLLEEAFVEYTAILDGADDIALADLYWLHRHRCAAAFLLGEIEIGYKDLDKMEEVLIMLGYPTDSMDEFEILIYKVLDAFEALEKDNILGEGQLKAQVCSGFWHCMKRGGEYLKSGFNRVCDDGKETWYRVTNNEEKLSKLMVERKAKELYYPNLVNSAEEMQMRERELVYLWDSLKTETKDFLTENHVAYLESAAANTALAIALPHAKSFAGAATAGAALITSYTAYKKLPDSDPLKQDLREFISKSKEYAQRDNENKEASFVKCQGEGVVPSIQYVSNQDSIWSEAYRSFDVNERGVMLFIPMVSF